MMVTPMKIYDDENHGDDDTNKDYDKDDEVYWPREISRADDFHQQRHVNNDRHQQGHLCQNRRDKE